MITFDQFEKIADYVTCELPDELFKQLNGGVNVLEYTKIHSESSLNNPMFILGEYIHTHAEGRIIYLYYGSFIRLYGDLDIEQFTCAVRKTIRHEFRHHIESLAGEKDLIYEDNEYIKKYREKK